MKIARYVYEGTVRWGRVIDGTVAELDGFALEELASTGKEHSLEEIELLPPCSPGKIIAVGLNYRDHAAELGMAIPDEPIIFLKPPSSLLPSGGLIHYPAETRELDYEAELALVVKERCKDVPPSQADRYILGYCCANDVTARDLQRKDGQWTRSKSFDTFCPLGPWLETDLNPADLSITLRLNGEIKQASSTSMMIFNPFELLSFISRVMTLEPGDVILTGTPPGVGSMKRGDVVEVDIENIGVLRNRVT